MVWGTKVKEEVKLGVGNTFTSEVVVGGVALACRTDARPEQGRATELWPHSTGGVLHTRGCWQ